MCVVGRHNTSFIVHVRLYVQVIVKALIYERNPVRYEGLKDNFLLHLISLRRMENS